MSEPSEQAKRKASDLWDDETARSAYYRSENAIWRDALARVLQEHSDVAKKMQGRCFEDSEWFGYLQSLILPEEPDPLAEALSDLFGNICKMPLAASELRAKLAKRGLKIVEAKGDD